MPLHLLPPTNRAHQTITPPDDASNRAHPAQPVQEAACSGKDARKSPHTRGGKNRRTTTKHGQCNSKHEAPSGDDANPIARMHRAFELHCRGFRTAPIAEKLGVTPVPCAPTSSTTPSRSAPSIASTAI